MNINLTKLFSGLAIVGSMLYSSCGTQDPAKPGLEFMPDMYRSPAYKSYAPSAFFADSTSARTPVAGTIPRNYVFFNYPSTNEGYIAAGNDLKNPYPETIQTLAQGEKLYNNFCVHCHGPQGNADGSLIATGKFPPPPSYVTGVSSRGGNMRDLSDGKIFHTITYGINMMGPHAMLLDVEERWKVTMYVRKLMRAGSAQQDSIASVTVPGDTTAAMNK